MAECYSNPLVDLGDFPTDCGIATDEDGWVTDSVAKLALLDKDGSSFVAETPSSSDRRQPSFAHCPSPGGYFGSRSMDLLCHLPDTPVNRSPAAAVLRGGGGLLPPSMKDSGLSTPAGLAHAPSPSSSPLAGVRLRITDDLKQLDIRLDQIRNMAERTLMGESSPYISELQSPKSEAPKDESPLVRTALGRLAHNSPLGGAKTNSWPRRTAETLESIGSISLSPASPVSTSPSSSSHGSSSHGSSIRGSSIHGSSIQTSAELSSTTGAPSSTTSSIALSFTSNPQSSMSIAPASTVSDTNSFCISHVAPMSTAGYGTPSIASSSDMQSIAGDLAPPPAAADAKLSITNSKALNLPSDQLELLRLSRNRIEFEMTERFCKASQSLNLSWDGMQAVQVAVCITGSCAFNASFDSGSTSCLLSPHSVTKLSIQYHPLQSGDHKAHAVFKCFGAVDTKQVQVRLCGSCSAGRFEFAEDIFTQLALNSSRRLLQLCVRNKTAQTRQLCVKTSASDQLETQMILEPKATVETVVHYAVHLQSGHGELLLTETNIPGSMNDDAMLTMYLPVLDLSSEAPATAETEQWGWNAPAQLEFGKCSASIEEQRELLLVNKCSEAMWLQLSTADESFQVAPQVCLQPRSSCLVPVRLSCTHPGEYSTVLRVTREGDQQQVRVVVLTGSVVQPSWLLEPDLQWMDLGTLDVCTPSPSICSVWAVNTCSVQITLQCSLVSECAGWHFHSGTERIRSMELKLEPHSRAQLLVGLDVAGVVTRQLDELVSLQGELILQHATTRYKRVVSLTAAVGSSSIELLPESLPVVLHQQTEAHLTSHHVTLLNRGAVPTTVRLSTTGELQLCCVSPQCAVVPAEGSVDAVVRLNPGSEHLSGHTPCALRVESASSSFSVPITTTTSSPHLLCDKTLIHFGCLIDRGTEETFSIRNDGTSHCSLSCEIRDTHSRPEAQFHIVDGAGPVEMAVGDVHCVTVRFRATAASHTHTAAVLTAEVAMMVGGLHPAGSLPLRGFVGAANIQIDGNAAKIQWQKSAVKGLFSAELTVRNCGDRAGFISCEDLCVDVVPRRCVLQSGQSRTLSLSTVQTSSNLSIALYHGNECLRQQLRDALRHAAPSGEVFEVPDAAAAEIDFDLEFEGETITNSGALADAERLFDHSTFWQSLVCTRMLLIPPQSIADIRNAPSDGDRVDGLYLELTHAQFETTMVGGQSVVKLRVCNRAAEELVVKVRQPRAPFRVKHTNLSLKARSYVLLPIMFRPNTAGSFEGHIQLYEQQKESNVVSCILHGSCS